ncbi:MAG: sugar nucleotide-binding protein, partial [Chloroflexi bacterium]|nr:sugar nucleotide-binding protein [Chloroflexota bacterium]
ERDVRLVHLSIDLVFSDHPVGGFVESDATDPVTVYGKTMVSGEQLILDWMPLACILRISLPMGISPGGHAGAIDWIQSRFKKMKPATLYFDEIRTPTYTDCLNELYAVSLAGDLLVTVVVGELQGGVGAYDLVQRGVVADYTIVCEPSELEVRTIHSGAIQMLVHVTGESAWIGVLHREKYVNAIEKMTSVIDALKEVRFSVPLRDDLVGLPRMVVGGIMGGLGRDYGHGRPAYVPDFCTIILEVRGLPGQDWDQTREDIEVALRRLRSQDTELRYEIEMPPATYGPHWHSMKVPGHGIDVPTDHDFPQTVRRHHIEVLGAEPANVGFQNPGSYAWTDAGHFTRGGSLAIIYGPTANLVRTVDIEKVMNCARVLALTAADICTRGK